MTAHGRSSRRRPALEVWYRDRVITAAVSAAIVGALGTVGIVPSAGQIVAIVVGVKVLVGSTIALAAFWIARRRRVR